jgi:Cu+-exporting ATPase
MHCATGASRIEKALLKMDGVSSAFVNLASEKATIDHADKVDPDSLIKAIEQVGFTAVLAGSSQKAPDALKQYGQKLALAAPLSLTIMLLYFVPHFNGLAYILWLLATPVQFWAGLPFYSGAWKATRARTADMNTLIVVGTSAAYFLVLRCPFPRNFKFA